MSTAWEPIETQAMTYIKNDLSLDWDMKNRLAVFYNRMAAYMEWAIPLFNRPPEILLKLRDIAAPDFEDVDYTPTEAQEAPVTIETGLTGFDICSCGLVAKNQFGGIEYTPVSCVYDSASGDVVVNTALTAEDTLSINLYKSGAFAADLNRTEQTILAYGIYAAWEHRFDNNAIERTSKIRDSSFTTISEASQTNANTARQKEVMQQFYGMLRHYERNRNYIETVLSTSI
nr:MAG TPA: hypothetical protein [Caudoviricetes sp.]